MWMVLTLVVGLALTPAVHASTLSVTDGFLAFAPRDQGGIFSGDGFSVSYGAGWGYDPSVAFGSGVISIGTGLRGVTVGEASCTLSSSLGDCGHVTFTSAGLETPPADWPSDVPFVAAAPFTATGELFIGDGFAVWQGFDFVGQGVLTGTVCRGASGSCVDASRLEYRFSVPEPELTVLTLLGAAWLGAAQWIARRRRAMEV